MAAEPAPQRRKTKGQFAERPAQSASAKVHELPASAGDAERRSWLQGHEPVVLRGAVAAWPAAAAWQGDAGLERMARLAGDAPVQVMSAASEVFFGAIEQHEPEDMTFGDFIRLVPRQGSVGGAEAASTSAAAVRSAAAGQPPAAAARHGSSSAAAPSAAGEAGAETAEASPATAASAPGAHNSNDSSTVAGVPQNSAQAGAEQPQQHGWHFYLAQADLPCIWSNQQSGGAAADCSAVAQSSQAQPCSSLAALAVDFQPPTLLRGVASGELQTNLWMSIRGSRSSLHYDPYQNLLCVVRGCKTVHLHATQQTPALYPKPVYGEAANHSSVNFAAPDLDRHPAYAQALACQVVAELQAGDAIYIPEGWWHQIDSADVTIAVNFWWQSPFAAGLQAAASPVHLREVARALTARRVDAWVAAVQPWPEHVASGNGASATGTTDAAGASSARAAAEAGQQPDSQPTVSAIGQLSEMAGDAPPAASPAGPSTAASPPAASDNELGFGPPMQRDLQAASIFAVLTARALQGHSGGSDGDHDGSADGHGTTEPSSRAVPAAEGAGWHVSPPPEDLGSQHLLTRMLAGLSPAEMCRTLLVMARRYPSALEGLLLHTLPPLAAEILLRKLEAADELLAMPAARAPFYATVYGVVGDSRQLLAALLAKKGAVAQQACRQVVAEALGS